MKPAWKAGLALLILLALPLSLVYSGIIQAPGPPELTPPQPEKPLRLKLRVAVVSDDSFFIKRFSEAVQAEEVRVTPARRAAEALGYDLVVIGWDALPIVSSDRELVLKLLRSSKVLAAAEPGGDAVGTLLSKLAEPVRIGEKPEKPPQSLVAFHPVYEEDSYLKPGALGMNLVLVEAWELEGGRLGAGYTASSFKGKDEVGRAAAELLRRRFEKQDQRPESRLSRRQAFPFALQIEQWVHIGYWYSSRYPITSKGDPSKEVGNTWVYLSVAYCANCRRAGYPSNKAWLVFLGNHYARTRGGYSLPVRAIAVWVTEPSAAVVDARTTTFPDQAVARFEPTGGRVNGQISITLSYPPGTTYTTSILPQVTYDGSSLSAYSSYYGGRVTSAAVWRWGLTSYDGSSSTDYHMGGYAMLDGLEPMYFAVRVRANAYLWVRGIVDTATSGQLNFLFAAYTDRLNPQGWYRG